MTQQNINLGAYPNDPSADSLNVAFPKVQANFTELYGYVGRLSGTTAQRPIGPANATFYLDTTLGIPIWALATSGTGWINAAGVAV